MDARRPRKPRPSPDSTAFDAFLADQERTLGLSGMAFQDAWTLDLDRLRQCHIHVVAPDRRVIPFCAYNLTAADGRPLYRAPSANAARRSVTGDARRWMATRMGLAAPLTRKAMTAWQTRAARRNDRLRASREPVLSRAA